MHWDDLRENTKTDSGPRCLVCSAILVSTRREDSHAHPVRLRRPTKKQKIEKKSFLHTGCSLNIVFYLKMLCFFLTLQVLLQRWSSTCHLVVQA